MVKFILFLFVITYSLLNSECIEFITSALSVAVVSSLYAGWQYSKCNFFECCNSEWMVNDLKGLAFDFESKLHGQHLAKEIVLRALKNHLHNKMPRKALVLSFHGRTGSGKNHITNLAINRIFKMGSKSGAFNLWYSKKHFLHHDDLHLNEYRKEVQRTISNMVRTCSRSIFIFDEADHLPAAIRESLIPYMGCEQTVGGIDVRKAIFIFLSNTGDDNITKIAEKYFEDNRNRNDITMRDIYPLITTGCFKEKGDPDATGNNLVDFYVPFLPLELDHVMLCVEDYLNERECVVKEKFVQKVAYSMNFDDAHIFSLDGCKTINGKVNVMLEDECNK